MKKFALFLNYFIVAYVFVKFTKSDSAEIKKIRAEIKQLNLERERLQDKVDHFNDLLGKL